MTNVKDTLVGFPFQVCALNCLRNGGDLISKLFFKYFCSFYWHYVQVLFFVFVLISFVFFDFLKIYVFIWIFCIYFCFCLLFMAIDWPCLVLTFFCVFGLLSANICFTSRHLIFTILLLIFFLEFCTNLLWFTRFVAIRFLTYMRLVILLHKNHIKLQFILDLNIYVMIIKSALTALLWKHL